MLKKLLTLYLFSLSFAGFSQTFQWLKTPTVALNVNPNSLGYIATTDSSGNVYFAGYLDSPVIYTEIFGNLFYTKYSSSGTPLFTKTFTGSGVLHQMTTDSAGNVLLSIEYLNTLVVDGVSIPNTNQITQHVFLKLSPQGNLLWHKILELPDGNVNTFQSIAVDGMDNIYLGYDSYFNGVIEKLSPTGTTLSTISQLNVNRITSISVDSVGNIYATGSCANINSSFAGVLQPTSFDYSLYLVKYSATGVFQWVKFAEDITCPEPMVKVFSPDEVYFSSSLFTDIDLGPLAVEGPTGGGTDFFVAKLDGLGNFQWAREVPGNGSADVGTKNYLSLDALGNVYFAGVVSGGLIDWGTGITTNTTSVGNREALLLKYDSSGGIQMAVSAGGIQNDEAHNVAIAADGSIYLTGLVRGSATFGTLSFTTSDPLLYTPFMAKIQNTTLSVAQNSRSLVRVFPNPVTDFLSIQTTEVIISATVYGLNGQRMALPFANNQFDFSGVANGVYFVEVVLENGVEMVKVVR